VRMTVRARVGDQEDHVTWTGVPGLECETPLHGLVDRLMAQVAVGQLLRTDSGRLLRRVDRWAVRRAIGPVVGRHVERPAVQRSRA
jgi:hypothetical protein